MGILNKLWSSRWMVRSIIPTIYFNFHYLPCSQAIHLPILLYKPHLLAMKGKIVIEGKVRFGMIKIGHRQVSIFPNSGMTWEDKGATITFKDRAWIGNDVYFSFDKGANVEIGDGFAVTAGLKFVSVDGVKIGHDVSLGWGCLLTDTNFHPLIDRMTGKMSSPNHKIEIGDYNWFAAKCNIMPGVKTPERCIFSIGMNVTRNLDFKPYRVHRIEENLIHSSSEVYRDINGPLDSWKACK